jgi:hypothetical protein
VLGLTPEGFARRITSRTEVVVEGFPRSGNTFAAWALRLSQPRDVVIASHVHVPAQVKLAVRRHLPVLVVVRPPIDAVSSLIVAAPHVRAAAGLREYAHHHRELYPIRDALLVATFDEVTTDFGQVTRRLNQRFGTTFEPFLSTPEREAAVFAAIEQHHAGPGGGSAPHIIPRPTPERSEDLLRARADLESPRLAGWLARANAAFEAITADRHG